MRKPFFIGLALLCATGAAHADVTWEHTASVSFGSPAPLVKFSLRNDWSGDNHRARFAFDTSPIISMLGGMPGMGGMTSGPPLHGTVDVIERLGDDRLIFALRNQQNTAVTNYVDEPYSTLQSRLRINFFEALDPKFAANAEPVPQLTDEQRTRLGQELRAFTKPITAAFSRQYFGVLPNKRTINGIECRGYRYTTLTKIPKAAGAGNDQWTRVTSEFWQSTGQVGDEEILSFTQRANELKSGAPTVSMWLNEVYPILMATMPDEAQAFQAALLGRKGDSNYGFRGTPVQFFITVTPPQAAKSMGINGSLRFRAELKSHSTMPIPARAFATPTEGEQLKIEPFLQIVRNLVKQGRGMIQEGLGSMI